MCKSFKATLTALHRKQGSALCNIVYAAPLYQRHLTRFDTLHINSTFYFLDGAKIRSFIETTKHFSRKIHFYMNISTKSLLILIFLCIFAAETNNKRNLNMKKLDIKRALSEHNMTQVELYQKIGMSPQAICMIIKNNNPTVAKLMQIAEGIGCDITDLFYPDPAEEAAEKHEGETLNATLRGDLPEGVIIRDVKFIQKAEEDEPAHLVHANGLVSENQQEASAVPTPGNMIQTSTFCPHCGKKVRVGVILLPEE